MTDLEKELLDMLKRIDEAEHGFGQWPKEKEIKKLILKAEGKNHG